MASVSWFSPRNFWRVQYLVHRNGGSERRARYARAKGEARVLANQLGQVEEATRRQYAAREEVEGWIAKGWLCEEEAGAIFVGFGEVVAHRRRQAALTEPTDYAPLLRAFEEYSLRAGKGGEAREYLKSHRNNLSMARQVVAWCPVPNARPGSRTIAPGGAPGNQDGQTSTVPTLSGLRPSRQRVAQSSSATLSQTPGKPSTRRGKYATRRPP